MNRKKDLKSRMHQVIFEADTRAGKLFDIVLLIAIVLSVILVMLETVGDYSERYKSTFFTLEVILTFLFTAEYFARIYSINKPWNYIKSFYGIIDLLSILPFFLGIFFTGSKSLSVIRGLRLLRIFRVLKLGHFLKESRLLIDAMKSSLNRIVVFLYFVVILVCIFGSLMYVIEGNSNSGFDSIPRSIYWAIVTLTTVGYGDISPVTPLGQFIASVIMIVGYAVIAVPTGIVTSEVMNAKNNQIDINTQSCPNCSKEGHEDDAEFCKFCGSELNP